MPISDLRTIRFADGSAITMRPIGTDDGRFLSSFLSQLSPESEYKRFLSSGGSVRSQWVAGLINADQADFLVYGAFADNSFGTDLVAVAESIRHRGDAERAEFALAAIDPWQNLGVGTLLAKSLADVVRSTGVRYWESYALADNRPITRVLSRVGRRVSSSVESGIATALYEL